VTDIQIFEPEGRAIPFIVEGDGPVGLVLIPERGQDQLGVVGHYLAEEAGFHVVRIGHRRTAGADAEPTLTERVDDILAVLDEIGFDHAWIGGHGFGGTIAREFVATHADRSNGLLLLGVEDADIPLAPVLPVLIIQGTDDVTTPPANGERLQSAAPERASIKTIDGGDHSFPGTHPIETAVIIEEYLDWD
jgi:pimeloyl-ACP methyl ester carboxylesterase